MKRLMLILILSVCATSVFAQAEKIRLYEGKTRQPLEIHSFTRGFHGFGYRDNGQSVYIWPTLFYNFLDNCNLLNKK